MKDKNRKVRLLMLVLGFMSISTGIWSNYRQLWLQTVGFDVTDISRILSVGLVCSAIISFIISSFSTKIKISAFHRYSKRQMKNIALELKVLLKK